MTNNILNENNIAKCYGCGICEYKCPTDAISIIENENGFRVPFVDSIKCINCGLCAKACPIGFDNKNKASKIYQAISKDEEVLMRSQSGGTFTLISDYVLEKGGSVYGSVIDENDHSVYHMRAINENNRNLMSGSKYVQSTITKRLYENLDKDIKSGIYVLFSGTPCQCAAVKKNYSQYTNLYVCDIICHGVPSPKLWELYLQHVSDKHNIVIKKAKFRNNQRLNIGRYVETFCDEDGTKYFENDYSTLYYSHLAHRESCFNCEFTSFYRCSDITIGDFWEPSEFNHKGSSMVLINTEKGEVLFDSIKDKMYFQESKVEYYKNQPCLYHPIPRPELRDEFWNDWKEKNIQKLIDKYATADIKKRFHIEIIEDRKER